MTEYSEREAAPGERDRGEVLDALAGGAYWAFLQCEIKEDGNLGLKLDMDDRIDTETLRAILRKTLEALP